jgi:hypothetical protein
MKKCDKATIATAERIESLILNVRGYRVILDSGLAEIYSVTTKHLNQQYRRNLDRFPKGFAFQLTPQEVAQMRSQIVTASRRNIRHAPIAFTEHGAVMLAMVLKSPVATEASIEAVKTFVFLREQLAAHKELAHKLTELEDRVSGHDSAIENLFEAIRQLIEPPLPETRQRIGFQETAPPYRVKARPRT